MSPRGPFQTVWANLGEAETELLEEILRDAERLLGRIHAERNAGSQVSAYTEHPSLGVTTRLTALLAHSPHVWVNFAEPNPSRRRITPDLHVVRPNG